MVKVDLTKADNEKINDALDTLKNDQKFFANESNNNHMNSQKLHEVEDTCSNLSDYFTAKDKRTKNEDDLQRAYDLWNMVGDTEMDNDNTETVDSKKELLEDNGSLDDADDRHAMDALDNYDDEDFVCDLGGGDIEPLDPDEAYDMTDTFRDAVKNYRKGTEDIY